MFGIWLAVAEGTLLGFEAQRVIALRAMKIAAMVTVWPAGDIGVGHYVALRGSGLMRGGLRADSPVPRFASGFRHRLG
jgi:hypothetical protein